MNTPFPFDGILTFAFLSVLLLMGVGLRARVGFFQRFLVPSCLIGGVLGLVLMHTEVCWSLKLLPSRPLPIIFLTSLLFPLD